MYSGVTRGAQVSTCLFNAFFSSEHVLEFSNDVSHYVLYSARIPMLTSIDEGHGRGCLFVMPYLDIIRSSNLCADGDIEVCRKGRLAYGCCDGTFDDCPLQYPSLICPDCFHYLLLPMSSSKRLRTRGTYV